VKVRASYHLVQVGQTLTTSSGWNLKVCFFCDNLEICLTGQRYLRRFSLPGQYIERTKVVAKLKGH
jgi:hypothetical protein